MRVGPMSVEVWHLNPALRNQEGGYRESQRLVGSAFAGSLFACRLLFCGLGFCFGSSFRSRGPEVLLQVDAEFDHAYAFTFEEFFLEGGVGFADQDFAPFAEDSVPGDAFPGGRGGHGAACAAGSAA